MSVKSSDLNELFRLAFSEPFSWLSEAPAREQNVNWIALSLEEACAGDIVLLAAAEITNKLLLKACKKEAAAVLILGDDALPKLTIPENMYVAVISGEHDINQAQRSLLTILINQRAAQHERAAKIHAQLSQLEAEEKGLDGLVKVMADISGEGILIQDKRGRVLAEYPSSAMVTIWDDIVKQLGSLHSLPKSLLDRKRAGSQQTIVTQDIPGSLERLVIPITVGEIARGYLSLVGVAGELDVLDYIVAEQGSLVCATEMARSKAIRETEKRLKGDLLTVLLQENISPRDSQMWAQAVGVDLTQDHVAIRFAWDAPSPPSRRRLETIVNGEVSRLGLITITSPMGVEVVSFCELPPATSRPELALEFGQAALDQASQEFPDVPIRCGIGNPAQELSAWRDSFRQAGQSLDMARRFEERKPLYFADLSVYRLLFQFEHNPELIAFQEEILGPLLAYEGGRELLLTLESYFEHNANMTQTAESLFIHRNTLIYRLDRISEIANLDLDKPETRLAVQIALHIYRMRAGIQGKPTGGERK
jgi:purine catabolism regulator